MLLIVCSCHVTYAFQSESTLYSCLNVTELLAWSRHKILDFAPGFEWNSGFRNSGFESSCNAFNAFNNNMSTDLKLSKFQISKIIQSGGLLGSLLSKLAGPLMKMAAPLAKNVLAPLGITATASAIDAGIQKKKIHGSGNLTLIISNEEMNDMMKIV